VEKLCNNFTNINPIFLNDGSTGHVDIFSQEEHVNYNKRLKEYLKPFIGATWSGVVQTQLKFMPTWDIYAVHVMFLILIYHTHIDEYNNETFTVIQQFIQKIKREVSALPTERKSYEDITAELMRDFGSAERKQVEVLTTTIHNASADDKRVEELKLKLSKLQLRELKKERHHYPQQQ
jgi:hypothetical protein